MTLASERPTMDIFPSPHVMYGQPFIYLDIVPLPPLCICCLLSPQFLLFSHFVQLLLSSPFLTLLSLSFPLNLSVCPSFYPLLPSYLHQSPSGGT